MDDLGGFLKKNKICLKSREFFNQWIKTVCNLYNNNRTEVEKEEVAKQEKLCERIVNCVILPFISVFSIYKNRVLLLDQ